jgi:hypothetical protein
MSGDRSAAEAHATFFTITDDRFVPGTIAMINSLRIVGHREPVVVLDCGVRDDQRRLLEPLARLVPWDRSQATNPTLFKPFAVLTEPQGVVVIIDSDVVVTASLEEVVRWAESGNICAFPDPEHDRWFAAWEEVFGLQSPPRHQPYVNAGFVAFSVRRWPDLLPRWWELCQSIWHAPTLYEKAGDGPTAQADQDALNALLMSEVSPDALNLLDPDLAPASGALSGGVRVVDESTLSCRYLGKTPVLLHSSGKAKPWIAGDWLYLRPTAYTRLLRRLLTWPDIAVRPRRSDLPPWLHPGPAGNAWMLTVTAVVGTAWRVGKMPWLRPTAQRALQLIYGNVGKWRARS